MPRQMVSTKDLKKFVKILRAKAIERCKKSEGDDTKKGYWIAGQAEAWGMAADHLETWIGLNEIETE